MQEPWFRKQTWSWYVELPDGTQKKLGKHPSETPPVKGKRGWNPPKAIAEAWMAVMRENGHVLAAKDIPVRQLFDEFLDHVRATVKPDTWNWYRVFVQDFADHFPALKATAVTETHVQKWLKSERPRPWGPTTQRSAITILKAAYNWAVKSRRLSDNPIRHMLKPPAQRRGRVPTPAERAHITGLFPPGDPFRDFLRALEESGARPGELMRLTAADVNLVEGVAVLSEHKTRGKTGRSRTIYLTANLTDLLAGLMRHYPQGELFRNADGNPWNRQAINCRFRRKKQRKTDPIDKSVVAYLWRHGWTTDALENGVPIATVAELLGHESTAVVSAHYSHLSERREHLRQAAEQAAKRPT
jgi:integrase